jgi:hypothetical protein
MSLMPLLLPLTQDHEYGSALHGTLVALRSTKSLGLLALRQLLDSARSITINIEWLGGVGLN